MIFRGWQKTSLIEYPGKVSTVLFAGGCNFRCPFCYNSDLVKKPGSLGKIEEDEVLSLLSRRRKLYQAVVITGGEPTMDKGLPAFMRKVKGMGFLVELETNGTNPGMLKGIIEEGLADYVAMDVKAPLTWEKYSAAACIKDRKLLENVKESLDIIISSGIDHEFRTTVVPGIHTEEDIREIADQLKGARLYALQQFTPRETTIEGKMSALRPYPDSFILEVAKKIGTTGLSVEARNLSTS